MIIKFKDQSFLVSFKRDNQNHVSEYKDQYGREFRVEWWETDIVCTVQLAYEKSFKSAIVYTGVAHCGYKDKFNLHYGRALALRRALTGSGLFSADEVDEFVRKTNEVVRVTDNLLPPQKPRLYPKVEPFKGVRHGGKPVVPQDKLRIKVKSGGDDTIEPEVV